MFMCLRLLSFFHKKNLIVQIGVYTVLQCMCVSGDSCYSSSDKARDSAARSALALLRCIHTHTHTHTGDNQPFPLPQHDAVCVCGRLCVPGYLCVNAALSPCDRWAPVVTAHMGGGGGWQKVTFGCDNLHTSQEMFGMEEKGGEGGGLLINWTDSRSAQIHLQDVPGC